MKKAASISGRAKALACRLSQKIITDHIKIIYGKGLGWKPELFYFNGNGHPIPVVKVPSPETYKYLKKLLEKPNKEIKVIRDGIFEFIPTNEGLLVFNNWKNPRIKRFKSRKDFKKFLLRLHKLVVLYPKYKKELRKNDWEAGKWNYKTIVAKKETRKAIETIKLLDNITVKLYDPVKEKKAMPFLVVEKKFVKKFWDGNYESYKKFKQRVKKDGLIQ